ncbi:hypothetical protein ACU40P_03435 [Staphylococcus arlettae]
MEHINDYKFFISLAGFILSLINFWFLFLKQRSNFKVEIKEIVDSRVEFYIQFIFINKSNKGLSITGMSAKSKEEQFSAVYDIQNIMSSKYYDEPYRTNGLPIKLEPYQSTKCYVQFDKNTADKNFDYDYLKFKISTSRQTKNVCIPTKKDLIIDLSDLYLR